MKTLGWKRMEQSPVIVIVCCRQSSDKKIGRLRLLKTRLNNLISTKSGTNSHGLSVAQDARLEFGLQWLPELRLRVREHFVPGVAHNLNHIFCSCFVVPKISLSCSSECLYFFVSPLF